MTQAAEQPVRPGHVLDGKFRVERVLGQGSMGLVVEATHLGLDERVALKFLHPEALARPDIVARFGREARAAVKIKSDHVARVFDVCSHAGAPFIVMEYLEGSDLGALLETRGQLEISEAVDYVLQACEGLAEAHARGIVHRDIKPENLFLTSGAGALKQVKILDFGISKAGIGVRGEVDLTSNETTQIMGSPQYMSPEQIRSTRDVDARADLWSLGVCLFELLTGRAPFPATEVTEVIAQILHDPHQRLRGLRPDAPEELERIVDTCLAKDAAQRFQSAADLALALLPFAPRHARSIVEKVTEIARSSGGLTGRREDSLPPPSPLSPPPAPTPAAAQTAPALDAPGSRARLRAFAVVLLLLLAGGAAALLARRPGRGTTATGADAPPTPTSTTAPTMTAMEVSETTAGASPVATASASPIATATPFGSAETAAVRPAPSATPRGRTTPHGRPGAATARPAGSVPAHESEIRRER